MSGDAIDLFWRNALTYPTFLFHRTLVSPNNRFAERPGLLVQRDAAHHLPAEDNTGDFVGPDGTAASYYSEATNGAPGPPAFPLKGLPPRRYFQWQATIQRDNSSLRPQLVDVSASATPP